MTSLPSHDEILDQLRRVQDPELRQDVVTLGMVGDLSCTQDGIAHVEILLTTPGCPLKQSFQAQVDDTVGKLPGVLGVQLTFGVLSDAQRTALREQLQGDRRHRSPGDSLPKAARVIAVTSGKGGVGKSTVAVNLAVALRARGQRVGIMDADVYGYSVPTMLGVHQRPVTVDGMIVPPVAHDLSVMSIGFFLDQDAAVIWRGPMLHRALEQFLGDVHWGDIDTLIVDMPPGTGDVAISLGQLLPRAEALVVTTPQHAAQTVARRAALGAMQLDQIVLGIVETMSDPKGGPAVFGTGGGQVLADELQVPLLATVPLAATIREGGDSGVPITSGSPDSAEAAEFLRLAEAVEQRRPKLPEAPSAPADRIKKPLALL